MSLVGKKDFLVLGVLNLTPDSFSDGGHFLAHDDAVKQFKALIDDGADYIDIGAESTRPGAEDVSEDSEWARLEPILSWSKKNDLISRVSVDTRKPDIMLRSAEMGVSFINCVGEIPETGALAALIKLRPGLRFIACHMHGSPSTMQLNPLSVSSAKKRVGAYFESSTADLLHAGFRSADIFMDPGIGFGKTDAANWSLLLEASKIWGPYNLAIGISRKGFIGRATGADTIPARDAASKIIEGYALTAGARLIRTHDVKTFRRFVGILTEAGV